MDHLLEVHSDELSTFIHWYYWSCASGTATIVVSCAAVLLVIYSQHRQITDYKDLNYHALSLCDHV